MEIKVLFRKIFSESFTLSEIEVALVIVTVFLLVFHRLLSNTGKLKLPPGPTGLPLLGYWPFVVNEPYRKLDRLSKKYGNVYSMYLGRKFALVCNDWTSVKEALGKTETLYRLPGVFKYVPLEMGMCSANGTEWNEQRKFSVKAMKDIVLGSPRWEELIQDEADAIVKHIESATDSTIRLKDVFGVPFARNVMAMVFGDSVPRGDPAVARATENMYILMQQAPSLGLGNFLPILTGFLVKCGMMGSKEAFHRIVEFTSYIHNLVEEKIRNVKKLMEQDSFVKTYYEELVQNNDKKLKNSFTHSYLLSNSHALVLGASESSSNTFQWLLVAMAEHRDKQALVHQELDRVLGKSGTLKYAERAKVPYTFAAILESMRWRTLVPIATLRMFSEATKVQGYDIPKGAVLVSNLWALHNDPKYWKDPEKFEPERFLKDDGKSVNFKPDSYIPFSYGRRNCPGELMALSEILIFFTTLMKKFTILPQEGDAKVKLTTHLGLTYQPLGVKLRFLPRE